MKLILSQDIFDEVSVKKFAVKVKPYLKLKNMLLLEGDLGAGKTTFINLLLESFGYTGVSSPTYAFRHTYLTDQLKIEHVDLYRLEGDEDIESIGLWDLFHNSESLIIIEWASRVPLSDWPMDWKRYQLEITVEGNRRKYNFYEAS